MKIGKWVIVDVKKLEHIIAELETTRKWIFWYWWGEEWLDCEDVVDNIGQSLPVIIRELKKSQRKKSQRLSGKTHTKVELTKRWQKAKAREKKRKRGLSNTLLLFLACTHYAVAVLVGYLDEVFAPNFLGELLCTAVQIVGAVLFQDEGIEFPVEDKDAVIVSMRRFDDVPCIIVCRGAGHEPFESEPH
jgi:cation transport ATPase